MGQASWPGRPFFSIRQIGTSPYNRIMPELFTSPARVQAAGNKEKIIDEYIGRVNSGTAAVSIAF
jgi:hypothetical protein